MPHLRLSPALGNAFAGNLCLECCQGHRQCTLCKKNWRFVLNILVFQLNDCQRSRLCHVSGNLVEVHGLRNVFAASLRRADCQGPLPCRLEQLVGFLTLHSASAMFSEDVDWKGSDFRVWRHLVGFRHFTMPHKVFFCNHTAQRGGRPPVCSGTLKIKAKTTYIRYPRNLPIQK